MASHAEPVILAVDLGTSGVRTALIAVHGRVLGWESEPLSLLITPNGGAEQSPDGCWPATWRQGTPSEPCVARRRARAHRR